jgi:membrane-associated protease RseP (regulator of RpoE activity)
MSDDFADWLLRTGAGTALVLLVTAGVLACSRQPARRQRLAQCGVLISFLVAILCLRPGWIRLPSLALEPVASKLPTSVAKQPIRSAHGTLERSVPEFPEPSSPDSFSSSVPAGPVSLLGWPDGDFSTDPSVSPGEQDAGSASAMPPGELIDSAPAAGTGRWLWIALVYVLCSGILLGRWLLGQCLLWRLVQSARPAPRALQDLLADLKSSKGRLPRLLVSARVSQPFSCGILCPTIVLPQSFVAPEWAWAMRWVLVHEMSHVERGDAWSCQLLGFAQACFFHLPWFWWLKKQVRLCQEFLADADVARHLGHAEDYAQFLVNLGRKQAAPLGTQGAFGKRSDLFRRITMLLENRNRIEQCCPRWCSLAAVAGLLALALGLAGINLRADAASNMLAPGGSANPGQGDPGDQERQASPPAPGLPPTPATPPIAELPAVPLTPPVGDYSPAPIAPLPGPAAAPTQEASPPAPPGLPPGAFSFGKGGGLAGQYFGEMFGGPVHGRLGISISRPSAALADQLDLPKGQGIVIEQVMPDSAAAKAGFKPHDILLELNGKKVSGDPQALSRAVQKIEAKTEFDAVVLRKGKKQTIKDISMPEVQETSGVWGAQPGAPGATPAMPGFPGGSGGRMGMMMGGVGPGQGFGVFNSAGRHDVMTTVIRNEDRFTTRYQEGSLIITLTGRVADGKAKVGKIHVQDGRESHSYESASNVPEEYRDKVENLIAMSEKGNLKVETGGSDSKKPARKKRIADPREED